MGILNNLFRHDSLEPLLTVHASLPGAVVRRALCGTEDSQALITACRLVEEACLGKVRRL